MASREHKRVPGARDRVGMVTRRGWAHLQALQWLDRHRGTLDQCTRAIRPHRCHQPRDDLNKESVAHRRPVLRLARTPLRWRDVAVHCKVDVGLHPARPTVALKLSCTCLLTKDGEAVMGKLAHCVALKLVEKLNDRARLDLVARLLRLTWRGRF